MKKVLVTGGSGFIGKHLCRELIQNGYKPVIFDRNPPSEKEFEYFQGDIRDKLKVNEAVKDCNIVFHLAGLLGVEFLSEYVREAIDINIGGSVNIFEAAKETGAIVVNCGLGPDWLNPYMITKKTSTRFGQMYFEMFKTEVVTLEITHVYGPGQPLGPYKKAIPTFSNCAIRNEHLMIHGNGQRLMDCIYVEDAVRAFRLVAESKEVLGSVLQLSSGDTIRVIDLAKKILAMTESQSVLQFLPMRPGEPEFVSDETEARMVPNVRDHLTWVPQITLEDGLRRTIKYFRNKIGVTNTQEYEHHQHHC